MLRVGVSSSTTATDSKDAQEEHHSFTFISASSSISDREHFKRELSLQIAHNKSLPPPVPNPLPSTSSLPPSTSTPSTNLTSTQSLKVRLLQSNPTLNALFTDLVRKRKIISEPEFWSGREGLLLQAEAEENQKKGKSGMMVDPKPETGEGGQVTVKVTPGLIREIFEEYPEVLRAYSDNVPVPVCHSPHHRHENHNPGILTLLRIKQLDSQQFWTRYFQSKLFNRNRSTNRAAVNTVKDDNIFDRYLGEEDDGSSLFKRLLALY